MKKLFVVVNTDTQRAVRAFVSESQADKHADDLYERTNMDHRVDEVWFDETPESEE